MLIVYDLSAAFNINFKMGEGQNISGPMTIISIVNGMIGGLILILPVMALQSGWLLTLIVVLITGSASYYSSYLCLDHTGDEPDLDIAIMKHFWGSRKIKVFYEFCIISGLLLVDLLYYELIVLQWIGLVPPHQYTPLNPLINFVALLAMVIIIKFKDFGVTLMAYGIVSIGAYLVFITWVAGSQESKMDGHSLSMINGNGIDLASALGQAFAIQNFFIPIMKRNNKPHKYKMYLLMVYILGTLAYAYIAFMGSYGILHRTFKETDAKTSKTIEGYFQTGTWEVNAIQIIYLVHLYSVFPQYLLLSKKRFFSIFKLKESKVGRINKKQILYVLFVLSLSLLISLFRASIREIIVINGSVIGFFFIYAFPASIHFKCAFMRPKKALLEEKKEQKYVQMVEQEARKQGQMQLERIVQTGENKNEIECANSDDKNMQKTLYSEKESQEVQNNSLKNNCKVPYRSVSKQQRICELVMLGFMVLLGLTIMIQGLASIFKGEVEE